MLAYWIKRVNTDLEEPDRIDVLKLVEHMQDRESCTMDNAMHNCVSSDEKAIREAI